MVKPSSICGLYRGTIPIQTSGQIWGIFEFYGIIPRPVGESKITITYRYNKMVLWKVEAKDQAEQRSKTSSFISRYPLTKFMRSAPPANIPVIVDYQWFFIWNSYEGNKAKFDTIVTSHAQDDRNFAIFTSPAFDDDTRMEYTLCTN